jgi:hypothetical protein
VCESESYISNNNDNTYSTILNYISKYSSSYSSSNKTKQLIWYLHYGEVEVIYKNKNIKLLPIQYLILEFFNYDNYSLPLSDILQSEILSQYPKQYLINTINSLISGNILFMTNNCLIVNEDYNFSSDLINMYNLENLNNNDTISYQLAHEDRYIILTNINSVVKHTCLSYNDLFDVVKNNIKVLSTGITTFSDNINVSDNTNKKIRPVHSEFKINNCIIIISSTHWCNLDTIETPINLSILKSYTLETYGDEAVQELDLMVSQYENNSVLLKRTLSESIKRLTSGEGSNKYMKK